ncbi:MAG: tRNA uridine-5-carboxymethylaminomethyl(34) synthesis GTPase MnmE [Proteobacteria bacterium]|nr:MAG: tRNA uridine-5-carboxymethylaminomethyl(34) synthesis GTPase MnmE [Pseudomonadota bacterium]
MSGANADTIVAVATPPGTGGVGIVRLSGSQAAAICEAVAGRLPPPRRACYRAFREFDGRIMDRGIILFFPAPASFTGEDVVEFQGHGGYVVLDMLVERCVEEGARLARPGEFSERAFLNGRMDLVQAEAVADLIESSTRDAARLAMKSVEGEFSARIAECAESMLSIRAFVEAAIDFPDEEIDFLSESDIAGRLDHAIDLVDRTRKECHRGAVVRNGLEVVLCGAPNAGKSSLMNALARKQRAIVSAQPGTTRDLVDERVQVGGVVLNLVDTAGLREVADDIEREGISRARAAIDRCDLALLVCDDREDAAETEALLASLPADVPRLVVRNKIDLSGRAPGRDEAGRLCVSAATGAGIECLERTLLERSRRGGEQDTRFLARRRHLDALDRGAAHLADAHREFVAGNGELMAESLRMAHLALGEITGEVTSDDLLGHIFGSFCIGK